MNNNTNNPTTNPIDYSPEYFTSRELVEISKGNYPQKLLDMGYTRAELEDIKDLAEYITEGYSCNDIHDIRGISEELSNLFYNFLGPWL